ncbi:MAG: SagB family peptide dehydrogenase [Candidatus Acidiferrales bacterium]
MAKAKQALFRRSPFLISYWNAGKLIFENYATGKGVTAAPLATEVLDFFSRWRSADAIFRKLPRYSPSSLRAAIRGLARHTLLQRSDRKPHPMERAMAAWSHWNPAAGFFHFTGRDLPFTADLLRTGRYMEELTREKAMPVPVKRYPGAEQTRLLPAHENGEFPRVLTARRTWRRFALGKLSFADLSTLLGLTFGVREWVAVPPLGRFAVKTSPSGGALHPIEAYVVARDVEGISPGIYHYDASRHRLELLRPGMTRDRMSDYVIGQRWFSDACAFVVMTAVFTRTQWKYRYPRAYRVVLAECGHLCQTFCLTATWLGLAPFCTMALADSKIDRDLGLDGVTEGALYVAGVGQVPKGVDWKTASLPVDPTGKKKRRRK